MPNLGIIDLVIGLTFAFGITAAVSSAATELVARLIGLRGAYLLGGLSELLDDGEEITILADAQAVYNDTQNMMRTAPGPAAKVPSATAALLGGPVLRGQVSGSELVLVPAGRLGRQPELRGIQGARNLWSQRRSVPSYLPARSFAEAVIDLVAPDAAGQMTMTAIRQNVDSLPASMSTLKASLQALAKNAGEDVSRFRTEIEHWYDDHMDRVSGWYKRRVAKITLVAGTILILLVNINALTIGRTLYTESTVSTAVSAVAANGADCPVNSTRQACLANLQAQLSATAAAGLPIGWGTVRDCIEPRAQCNWLDQRGIFSRHGNSGWQLMLVLIGFLIMIVALVPGARFWFGLLSRFGSIRATGPKPATAGRPALIRDARRPPPAAVEGTTKSDSRGPVGPGGGTGPVKQRPDDKGFEKQLKPKRQLVKRAAAASAVIVTAVVGGVAAAETTALYWLGVLTTAGTVLAAFGVYEVAGFGRRRRSRRQLPTDVGDQGQEDDGDVSGGAVDEAVDLPERAERADPGSAADSDDDGDGGAAEDTEEPEPAFYVNAFVTLAGEDAPVLGAPLELRTNYEILCGIGVPDLRSSLHGSDAVFPRDLLPEGVLELRAVLQVEGVPGVQIGTLEISAESTEADWARLPLPVAESPTTIHAQLAIYYEVVAVYIQAFTVPVGGPARRGGPTAQLVYRLSTPFAELGKLRDRHASVVRADQPGESSVLVNGLTFAPNAFAIAHNAADNAVKVARLRMYEAHFEVAGNGKEINRYSAKRTKYVQQHGKAAAEFKEDLARLASAGHTIYDALFRENIVAGTLADLLRLETSAHDRVPVVQVVDLSVGHLPIPWALLYDLPFSDSGAYEECPSIADFGPGHEVHGEIPARCPYEQRHRDTDLRWRDGQLCPWGFWGLSAVLEHPPYVSRTRLEAVVSEDPALPRAFLMASGPDLDDDLRGEHIRELDRQAPNEWTRPPIGGAQDLKNKLAPESMDVIYFYCHCDYAEDAPGIGLKPYLRLDNTEPVTPSVISAWAQSSAWPDPHWPRRHPLVVINGCRTAEWQSGSLSDFVDAFANRAGAAGVVGTEITIDQGIASWAMGLFFDALCQGATVGMALRQARWAMFGRGNLMGFAYTPYCLASLTLRRVIEPPGRTA